MGRPRPEPRDDVIASWASSVRVRSLCVSDFFNRSLCAAVLVCLCFSLERKKVCLSSSVCVAGAGGRPVSAIPASEFEAKAAWATQRDTVSPSSCARVPL